jgi:hypothetical protein
VGLLLAFPGRVVEVDKKGMLTTSLRGRVVEIDKKGMLTTSLRGRVVEVDKKGGLLLAFPSCRPPPLFLVGLL